MSETGLSPLAGIRVLEFSHTIMGPCAGLVMADLGAEVIKIEPAPGGDKTRQLNGFAAGFFSTFNRNKQSVAIDLKSSQGQALVHQLVEGADVVIENYGPGTMERLGCGWEQLSAINSKLIYLSLKGFLTGPWQDRAALDEVVQFESGLAYMTGPAGQPLRAGASIVDILGAVFGVTGVLAALRERDSTGCGQRVGSALFESAAFLMASHMAGGAATGEIVPPMTARQGAWGIYDVFDTVDEKQLFIGVTSDSQWQRFCESFDLTELFGDERLQTNPQRTACRSWMLPEVRRVLLQHPYEVVLQRCTDADVSYAPVGQPEDLWRHPQLQENGGLLDIELLNAGVVAASRALLPGMPLEFGEQRQRASVTRPVPECGEHSRSILNAVGVSDEVYDALLRNGVVAACNKA